MPGFNVLVYFLSKVFFDNGYLTEGCAGVVVFLQTGEKVGEKGKSFVFAVADKEGEVDEVVRVGKVAQVGEEHGQVGCGVTERCAEEDALIAFPASACASYVGEVIVADGFNVELFAIAAAEKTKGEGGEEAGGS